MFSEGILKTYKIKFTLLFLAVLVGVITEPISLKVYAAATYDHVEGSYTEDFADNTGLSSRTRTSTDGFLKLTDESNVIASPYVTSGTAVTAVIIPTTIAKWGTLTLTSVIPTGTTIKVQILDEAGGIFDDELLNGNEAGFTTSSIDLSSLPLDRTVSTGSAKIARIGIKFILTTTDTSVTPALDAFVLSWTKTEGDLSASALASHGWSLPTGDLYNRNHMSGSSVYVVPRWAKNQGVDYGGSTLRGAGEIIYNKTQGGIVSWPETTDGSLSAIDRRTGETLWTRIISGYAFTSPGITLAANGSIYVNDNFNDVLVVYDGSDGSVKWSYQFSSGHGNSAVNIDPEGTVYMTKSDSDDDTFTILAFNPDGTVKWSTTENPALQVSSGQVSAHNGKIYVPTSGLSGGVNNNTGALYAFDAETGMKQWTYPTGDAGGPPIIDDDGTIYVANSSSFSAAKSIYAINPDGTLKWSYAIAPTTDYWGKMTLRSDGVLVASRVNSAYPDTGGMLDALDTTDGSLLWSQSIISTDDSFGSEFISDSANGMVVRSIVYTESTSLDYYDANRTNKWTWSRDSGGSDIRLGFLSGDEDGNLYVSIFTGGDMGASASTLVALAPWDISVSVGEGEIQAGDDIIISATTTMPRLDPITGTANKLQAVMEDNTKVLLDYVSVDSEGLTLWQGAYTVPAGSSGIHNFNVEASSVMMSTDVVTHFDSPANSDNTGRIVNSSFEISPTPSSSTSSGSRAIKKIIPIPATTTLVPNLPIFDECRPGDLFSYITGASCGSFKLSFLPTCAITSTLKFGDRGAQVRCLQSSFDLINDGIFGHKTKTAVILFQQRKNLVPDGIFGPMSLSAWSQKE